MAGGLFFYIVIYVTLSRAFPQFFPSNVIYFLATILFVCFGSLAPDLDHPKSKIHRLMVKLAIITILFSVIAIAIGINARRLLMIAIVLTFLSMVSLFSEHRGAWHSWIGLLAGSLIIYSFSNVMGVGGDILFVTGYVIGYLSHLILDHI